MVIESSQKPILSVEGLTKIYGQGCRVCLDESWAHDSNQCPKCGSLHAVREASLELGSGEILGIIGESGSGKSTLLKMMIFDEVATRGKVSFLQGFRQLPLLELNAARQNYIRNHHFGVVYQNPHLGLNFKVSAGGNIAERLLMSDQKNYEVIRSRASNLLQRTEVPYSRMDSLPSQFSGGMQQRVQIAKALAPEPEILFLDEVTTGLDLSVQAKILDLILELQHQSGISMIVVTHDLGVVKLLASRTLVMKNGKIIEQGLTDQILEDPQEPYTQKLVASSL
jgi:putative phosphonate transport system ATP-binding protein